jgi:predicted O-methyltransferase YrrM
LNFFLLKEWVSHFHLKTDEHALHSPFFFHFYRTFLKPEKKLSFIDSIEVGRRGYLQSEEKIEITDLGAGSKVMSGNKRKVKDIAHNSLSSPKFSAFLYNLIQHFQFTQVIELGTCLGMNTAYMAAGNDKAEIFTFEGDKNLIRLAQKACTNYVNIQFIHGNIDNTLPDFLSTRTKPLDLVYLDANHTYEATLHYFNLLLPYQHNQSIFIFDDIHWSSEMKQAWKKIKQHPSVSSSIDIFDAGLIFFNPDFQKQHHVLDF